MRYGTAWKGYTPKTRLLKIGLNQFLAGKLGKPVDYLEGVKGE